MIASPARDLCRADPKAWITVSIRDTDNSDRRDLGLGVRGNDEGLG
jgi:hypothetical protein